MLNDAPEFFDPAEDCPWCTPREILARHGDVPLPPAELKAKGMTHEELWLRYYATNEERAKHAQEYPADKLPAKEKPVSNRDWRLPKGPF